VKKYLALLSGSPGDSLLGNHDLDERNPEARRSPRWIGDVRALGIACDGDSLTIAIPFLRSVPGGMDRLSARIETSFAKLPRAAQAMDLGPSCRRRILRPLGRQTLFRRRRTGAVDPELSAFDGDLGPCASIAVIADGSCFDQLGSTWVFNAGLQPAAAGAYRARYRRRTLLAAARLRAIHRPHAPLQRPAAAITNPPEWLISLGRIADPTPHGEIVIGAVDHGLQNLATIAR